MAFQSLYRRYRPRRFSEVRGQEHVVRALRNAVAGGTVAHAYLFSGPRGTGKTSTARILAKALNCEAPVEGEPCCVCGPCLAVEAGTSLDASELDAASNNGVEAMRDLVARVSMAGAGRTRLYILDEVHMLSAGASNALLKTLEEPPPHVVFVLATTDPQKVLPTIRSRTQTYEFHLLPAETLAAHLHWVVDDAGLQVGDEAVDSAVRRGQGSARDALSALDHIVAAGGVLDDSAAVDEMAEALCERDTGRALTAVASACSAGRDPRHLADALLAHLRDAFLSVVAPDVVSLPDAARESVADQGRRLGPAAAVRALDVIGEALLAMREGPDPRVILEVALVRVTRPETDDAPSALVERIERIERALRAGALTQDGDAGSSATGLPAGSSLPGVAAGGSMTTPAGSARQAARQAVRAVAGSEPVREQGTAGAADASRPALGGLRSDRGAKAPTAEAPIATPPSATAPAGVAASVPVSADQASCSGAGTSAGPGAAIPLPSRDELTLAWADHILSDLRPVAKGLFSAGRFAAVDDNTVTFAVPTDGMRRKCEERRRDVEAALAAFFGRPIPLRLTVDSASAAQPAEGGHPEASLAEPVDLDDLRDAPPDDRRSIDRLNQIFPGSEVVDESGPSAAR